MYDPNSWDDVDCALGEPRRDEFLSDRTFAIAWEAWRVREHERESAAPAGES